MQEFMASSGVMLPDRAVGVPLGPPWPAVPLLPFAQPTACPCVSLLPSPSLQYLPVPSSGVRSVRCCEMSHRELLGHPCSAALPDSSPTLSVFCTSAGPSYLSEPCLPPTLIQQFSPVSSKTERKGRWAESIIVSAHSSTEIAAKFVLLTHTFVAKGLG